MAGRGSDMKTVVSGNEVSYEMEWEFQGRGLGDREKGYCHHSDLDTPGGPRVPEPELRALRRRVCRAIAHPHRDGER